MTETVEVEPPQIPSSIGRWKTYPAYKDSGVEWLGKIPEHWEAKKIKRLGQVKRGASPRPIDDPIYFDEKGDYAWVRISDVTASARYLLNTEQKLSYLGQSRSVCLEPGEIFLSIAGTVGKPIITHIKCCIHDGFVYFTHLYQSREYLFYIFSGGELYKGLGKLGTQLNLNTDTIGDIKIPIPAYSEQQTIATFLERETGKINTLIDKKERLIELLQEKRAALISHAVTKGLDPDVKMKDSGVEWWGEIPEHWKIGKLGAVSIVKARLGWKGLKADEYVDAGYIFLFTPNIKGRDIDFTNVNYITAERYFESPEIMLRTGDVLIAKDGSTLGIANVIRNLPDPTTVNSSIAVLRPGGLLDSVFLYWFLSSGYIQGFIQSMKGGMGIPHLFQADLRKFIVLIPPPAEQQIIAAFLDEETARIDALITKIGEAIEKLKEYSMALISAAVTGKIDVRDEVASVGEVDFGA